MGACNPKGFPRSLRRSLQGAELGSYQLVDLDKWGDSIMFGFDSDGCCLPKAPQDPRFEKVRGDVESLLVAAQKLIHMAPTPPGTKLGVDMFATKEALDEAWLQKMNDVLTERGLISQFVPYIPQNYVQCCTSKRRFYTGAGRLFIYSVKDEKALHQATELENYANYLNREWWTIIRPGFPVKQFEMVRATKEEELKKKKGAQSPVIADQRV